MLSVVFFVCVCIFGFIWHFNHSSAMHNDFSLRTFYGRMEWAELSAYKILIRIAHNSTFYSLRCAEIADAIYLPLTLVNARNVGQCLALHPH